MTVHRKSIPEKIVVVGHGLGRHVEHDERSKEHPWEGVVEAAALKTVFHKRIGKVFNQGNLGSCTGNAMAGAINTVPLHEAGMRTLVEDDAVILYKLATKLDGFPGVYPPDDTGSSGLAVCKAAKQKGYISGYKHAFGISQALSALQVVPTIAGINWYEGFDSPDANGLVKIAGEIRGGHEIEQVGFQLESSLDESLIICENSWGASWGASINGAPGRFAFTVATYRQLLADQGDVTIPVKK